MRVVVADVLQEYPPQMGFIQDDHMVEAFAPDTADQPFYVAVLPRRCVSREEWVYAECPYGLGEQFAELRITISAEGIRAVRDHKTRFAIAEYTSERWDWP